MTNDLSRLFVLLVFFILSSACTAEQNQSPKDTISKKQDALSDEQKSQILSKLQAARPDLTFTDVRRTADPALFEVEYNDGPVVYTTASGNFFLVGDLFTFKGGQIVNVTEQKKSAERAKLVSEINPADMISFGPPSSQAKAELYVFTDVDCGYCRKLHSEMADLNEFGVRVNYLAYPRAGVGSPVAQKMQSAWCAVNRADALTKLKLGDAIPAKICNSSAVADQYQLGQRVGVTGTPALLTSDGTLIPGYRPAADLAAMLGVK